MVRNQARRHSNQRHREARNNAPSIEIVQFVEDNKDNRVVGLPMDRLRVDELDSPLEPDATERRQREL